MSGRRLRLALALAAIALLARPALAAEPALSAPQASFSDWAAVIVAGDFHAQNGAATEAFDNARRDVAAAFARAGFDPRNLRQLSVRPHRYPDQKPLKASVRQLQTALSGAAAAARGGCLVYLTSHGTPSGAVLNEELLSPTALARMVNASCGERPTVVVVSACYSGVFIPALSGPNRLVMTAARPDRSSFGCTEDDTYPYFDACLLQSLPRAQDFGALPRLVRTCVDRRETAQRLTPPSEPQSRIGGRLAPILPLLPFLSPAA